MHIDLSLARGLDYYTGVIYEAVLVDGETKARFLIVFSAVFFFLNLILPPVVGGEHRCGRQVRQHGRAVRRQGYSCSRSFYWSANLPSHDFVNLPLTQFG